MRGVLDLRIRTRLARFLSAAAALDLRNSKILLGAAGARCGASTVGSAKRFGGLPKHVGVATCAATCVKEMKTRIIF